MSEKAKKALVAGNIMGQSPKTITGTHYPIPNDASALPVQRLLGRNVTQETGGFVSTSYLVFCVVRGPKSLWFWHPEP